MIQALCTQGLRLLPLAMTVDQLNPDMTKTTKRATKTIENQSPYFHLKLLLNHQRFGYRQILLDYQHQ